jgi:SEC-C motif
MICKEVYETLANATIEDNSNDDTFLGLSIHDAFNCNFKDLLPIVKVLFDKDYIDETICGEYKDVVNEFKDNNYVPDKRELKSIKDFYAEVCEDWESNEDKNEDVNFDDFEIMDDVDTHILPIRTEPKIGRNDPCPCGSGKKYKKCCLKD